MFRPFRNLSVKLRLSIAILTLCGVTLIVSAVSLLMLRNAESWLDTIHRETLTEVSQALEISRNAAELATAAPFLLTIQLPFQQQADADAILQTLTDLEEMTTDRKDLELPLARMRAAIANVLRLTAPQNALLAKISYVDGNLAHLQDVFTRGANKQGAALDERLAWTALNQITSEARGVARAQAIVEVGEFSRRYHLGRKALGQSPIVQRGLLDIEAVLASQSDDLFQLKYQSLTAELDAENALFRVRQLAGDISLYAAEQVEVAEERLRAARMQTTRNLNLAQSGVALFAVFSAVVAVVSALFVSRYVARNLRLIADGMHQLASGDHTTTLTHWSTSDDEIGRLFRAFGVFRDNAQKLDRRTAQIKRQNTLFSSVFRNITDGVAILSPDGKIEAENDKVCELLRLPPKRLKHETSMQQRISMTTFRQQAGAGGRGGFEEYTNPEGHVLEVRVSRLPDGRSVWLLSETTERKRIDERLEEIRSVETLGKVTGEVAHDFGNILSTISGTLHLLETVSITDAPSHMNRIRTAVDLGVSLTERLVAFARKQHLAPEVVDIGSLLEGMLDLLDIALPPTVNLELDIGEDHLHSLLDPGQLESAILNVCMNAAQAISGSGHIRITLREDQSQAVLSITDDGAGMSDETRRRAFEPFYSVRPEGEGTGLGLSMVYGFVTQSGGDIAIHSELAHGTEITIRFPIASPVAKLMDVGVFSGVVLIVDDREDIAVSIRTILDDLGFVTLLATRFSEAQDLLKQRSDISLIVSDLNLDHGQSGLRLIRDLLAQNQAALAILISSRLPGNSPMSPQYRHRFTMLDKPVAKDDLKNAIAHLQRGYSDGDALA